jgi:hypothetical protein
MARTTATEPTPVCKTLGMAAKSMPPMATSECRRIKRAYLFKRPKPCGAVAMRFKVVGKTAPKAM